MFLCFCDTIPRFKMRFTVLHASHSETFGNEAHQPVRLQSKEMTLGHNKYVTNQQDQFCPIIELQS
jgi:hypothetical protein